jgi:hypothetical protein
VPEFVLQGLDRFFLLFHAALVLFNVFGWIPPRWRRWNLLMLALTAASWLGLGLFYGLGYCPLTDWHWRVLRALGEDELPRSYTRYLVIRVLGRSPSGRVMDWITAGTFSMAFVVSLALNVRDWRRARS